MLNYFQKKFFTTGLVLSVPILKPIPRMLISKEKIVNSKHPKIHLKMNSQNFSFQASL